MPVQGPIEESIVRSRGSQVTDRRLETVQGRRSSARGWIRAVLAAAVLTLSGCAGEPDSGSEPEGAAAPEAAVPEVVAAFAAAWAEEDPWTATGFLCPDSPMDASELEVSGDPPVPDEAPIGRIRIDGPPSPGPYEGGLVASTRRKSYPDGGEDRSPEADGTGVTTMSDQGPTPRRDGFSMPAEWEAHEACLMGWPTSTRAELWGERFEEAKRDYATVANSVAAFEPVVMVCDPEQEAEARRYCGDDIEILPIPIDDSWMRDNGPIFVRDGSGGVALVHFRFNAWGERFHPYDKDADVPRHIAQHLGMRRYHAPFVLEGGSFLVDGEGTLITTEQCLLNPNRNPLLSRAQIEDGLREYLGAKTIVWLGLGHGSDPSVSRSGHVDAIASYVAPGKVALLAPDDPADPSYESGRENLERLERARDAKGRGIEAIPFQTDPPGIVPYLNLYLPNGGVVMPVAGRPEDDQALEQIAKLFPDREVVTVPGTCLAHGGGGPHCITQQMPLGVPVPA